MLAATLRRSLGAEELIELGKARGLSQTTAVTTVPPKQMVTTEATRSESGVASRTVLVSKAEGQLLVQVIEKIKAFAENYTIEYISYCPMERWETSLRQAEGWVQEIERQLAAGAQQVAVPAEAIFRLVDLEKCISAARDARLDSARLAFGITAGATIASNLLGWKWVSIPAYLAGLAIIFGRPLMAKFYPEPQDPYQPSLAGVQRFTLGGCGAPKETEEQKKRVKLIERIILPEEEGLKSYYWGEVDCAGQGPRSSVCLAKGRFRVRVEGFAGDIVRPAGEWKYTKDCGENAINEIGVWETAGYRDTQFGPVPGRSIHPETYFVEYVGPNTNGRVRRAGPFGCPMDTRDHGIEDGGITKLGIDGEVVMFDAEGNLVEVPPLGG